MDVASPFSPSSDAPARPWRLVLMDSALGLELVAVLTVLVASVLRPGPHLDTLFWSIVAFAGCLLVFWRWRRLPMGARAAGACAPLIPVVYVLSSTGGIFPGIPLALGVVVTLLAIWFGRWTALAFTAVAAGVLVAAGHHVAGEQTDLRLDMLDPHLIGNWIRVALGFVAFSTVLAVTVDWVVREVERNARERTEAYYLLRRLYVRFEGAKEEERRHLARELHDELGQALTALKLQLKSAAKSASVGPSTALDGAVSLVDGLILQVRKLSVDLTPPLLAEAGLERAVRAHVESNPGLAGVSVELNLALEERLAPELEVAAFRVVQEALTNAVRHAEAKHVTVSVQRQGSDLVLSVVDDGRGFDLGEAERAAARGERFGLAGMRERVRGLLGTFAVVSRPGGGTSVSVRLPVATPA